MSKSRTETPATHHAPDVRRPSDHPGHAGRFANVTRMVFHPTPERPNTPNAGLVTYAPGAGFPAPQARIRAALVCGRRRMPLRRAHTPPPATWSIWKTPISSTRCTPKPAAPSSSCNIPAQRQAPAPSMTAASTAERLRRVWSRTWSGRGGAGRPVTRATRNLVPFPILAIWTPSTLVHAIFSISAVRRRRMMSSGLGTAMRHAPATFQSTAGQSLRLRPPIPPSHERCSPTPNRVLVPPSPLPF